VRFLIIFSMMWLYSFASHADIFDDYPDELARLGEVTIAYKDMGDQNGAPLVLIMSLGMPLTYWGDPLVRGLVDHGYRVVAMDNRDAGLSTRLDRLGSPNLAVDFAKLEAGEKVEPPYLLSDMAQDVVGLMDHLGIESAHIAGASLGGMIAQTMAIHFPDRVRSLISIMSSSGADDVPGVDGDIAPPEIPLSFILAYIEAMPGPGEPIEAYIEFGLEMWQIDTNNPALYDEAYARDRVSRDHQRSPGWGAQERQLLASLLSPSRVAGLKKLKCPTLVIHGDLDPTIPLAAGKHVAALVPGAKLVVIKGMGHGIPKALVPDLADAIYAHIDAVEAQ
jgi:pimeloyl-ACP methyl ester carboxylesterase